MNMIVLKDGIINSNPGKDDHDESRFFRGDPNYPRGAVYDSILYINDKTIALGEHLERLFQSAHILNFSLGRSLQKQIREWIQLVIEAAGSASQFLRITATPNHVVIVSRPLRIDPKIYTDGVTVCTERFERNPETRKAKTVYRPELDSFYERAGKRKIRGKKCFECLIYNQRDTIIEGTRSNILWVDEDGVLCWCEDALSGITQKIVLNIAENFGMPTRVGTLHRKTLTGIRELMMTKASTGICGIVQVDETMIADGTPGLITGQLYDRYQELILQR